MEKFLKASVVSIACFALPWLFAVWFFWESYSLSLPCPLLLSGFAAAMAGFLLYCDRENCLERFYRKVEPEKVRMSDAEGAVRLLIETARAFPEATLRGRLHARLSQRHAKLSRLLG